MSVGIEKLRAYPSTLSLSLGALADARGRSREETTERLLVEERSVMPPWEDPVTMAVNAAAPLLDDAERADVGLLIVGTETPVDLEKPISTWVHRFLELPSSCRNFEIKHACYSVTAATQMALGWLGTPAGRGRKALVVGTDASLLGIGEPYEFVLGAGAVAVVLSHQPSFLELEPGRSGVYAAEVTDVIRPSRRVETGSSEESLFAYLEAVDGAYDAYEEVVGEADFGARFAHVVYHAPFGGITFRAHKALSGRNPESTKAAAWADFERRSLPGLVHHRRTGGVYGGSTFLSLLGMADARDDLSPGDRVGIFSFGSGSCAELYDGVVGPRAREVAARAETRAQLDARDPIDVGTYERLERWRDASVAKADLTIDRGALGHHYERRWAGRGRCVLRGVSGWVRDYAWS